MLMRRLRESLQREEGQALVLACLMVLVLSIAVLTTINIGHTVHERIRLQNTADAASYSMAAMEARAFNFYAFANRTQASHYVSAMVLQSFDSFIYFLQAFLTDIYGMMVTFDQCAPPSGAFWTAACPLVEKLPYIGPIVKVINQFVTQFGNLILQMQNLFKGDTLDKALAFLVSATRDLNKFLAGASRAVMASAFEHVLGPTNDILAAGTPAENDPNLGTQVAQIPLTYVNECMFDRAHFREANGSPFQFTFNPFDDNATDHLSAATVDHRAENDKIARAKRSMGQIANATRFACDTTNGWGPFSAACPDSFVTARRIGDFLPKVKIFGGNVLGQLAQYLDDLPVWGQTRLLSYRGAFGEDGYKVNPPGAEVPKCKKIGGWKYQYKPTNRIRQWQNPPNNENGNLAMGDNLGADDIYYFSLPPYFMNGGGWSFSIPGFKNPFNCDANEDWNHCWGDPRVKLSDPDDYLRPMKTSVWALNEKEKGWKGGIHWRVVTPGSGPKAQYGLNKVDKCVVGAFCKCVTSVPIYVANIQPVQESWHQWDGLVPFNHFEPGQYAAACGEQPNARGGDPSINTAADRASEFNQPSAWILFHKDPAALRNPNPDDTGATNNSPALLNDDGELTFQFGSTSQKLVMDDTRKKLFGFVSGVTVMSRAQSYYHRPGNWAEMPNFFNPYWKPRLASIYQGRNELPFIGQMLSAMPGPLKSVEQKVLTH